MDLPPLLLLCTVPSRHAANSGYHALAREFPRALFIQSSKQTTNPWAWFFSRAARRLALAKPYQDGSLEIELRGLRHLLAGFRGIVHYLWANHDLGFLDLLFGRRQVSCATFHNCVSEIPAAVRFPSRLKNLSAIILMSASQRQPFIDMGVRPERLHVVPHGVDLDYFHPGANQPTDQFTVLSVGSHRRDFKMLRLVAASLAFDRRFTFEVVAGNAAHRSFGPPLPNVRFLSSLSDTELLHRYQHASCLLQLVEDATANNVLLEAMACGLPIVSQRIGGIPEYVDDGCALLADAGDAEPIRTALIRLADNADLSTAMASAARTRATTFSWPLIAQQTATIYARIVSERL